MIESYRFVDQLLDHLRGHCPSARCTRRWPTRDRRSVTTAGVAMVPAALISAWSSLRSTISSRPQRVFNSVGHLIANEAYHHRSDAQAEDPGRLT